MDYERNPKVLETQTKNYMKNSSETAPFKMRKSIRIAGNFLKQ